MSWPAHHRPQEDGGSSCRPPGMGLLEIPLRDGQLRGLSWWPPGSQRSGWLLSVLCVRPDGGQSYVIILAMACRDGKSSSLASCRARWLSTSP